MSSTSQQRTLLTVGLPSHGKTTYLAALWYRLSRAQLQSTLKLKRLPDSAAYLNEISETWIDRQVPTHTPSGTFFEVALSLETADGRSIDVIFPDYSGEAIANAWSIRRWPGEFDTLAKRASAIAILVNPAHVYPASTIEELRLPATLDASPPDATIGAASYDPTASPTQVQLVDFLQTVFVRRSRGAKPPVVVIVTAWDLVKQEGVTPEEWLKARLPLLNQYLSCVGPTFRFNVFGVSATGGRIPEDRDELVCTEPGSRTESVLSTGSSTSDITEPIAWLIEASR
jgi:hypothetical protein